MSIGKLRDEQGFAGVTMRYEQGGAVQVFNWKDLEVRLSGSATMQDAAEALRAAEREKNASPPGG